MQFNIICASHDKEILCTNLARSVYFERHAIRLLAGYTNVPVAYNFGHHPCNSLLGEYNVYIHHDVFLPAGFEMELKRAIIQMNASDINWGVCGVAGAILDKETRRFYGHVKDRGVNWGTSSGLPREVQTLDELLLITKGDFTFDEQFDLHFYGADICMQSIAQGRKNYAISAHVHHNSNLKVGHRSESFKACEQKFKNKWQDFLPIVTTCALLQ